MTSSPSPITIRAVTSADETALRKFLRSGINLHRHLDWRDALSWLGEQPIWIQESDGRIKSLLICTEEPPGVAWVRLFGASFDLDAAQAWQALSNRFFSANAARAGKPVVACLVLQDWMAPLLSSSGFQHHQDIVALEYVRKEPPIFAPQEGYSIRLMQPEDIPEVANLDQASFETIWELSSEDLQHARARCEYRTVVEKDQRICAYQMSTMNGFSAHLARLAVLPEHQRHGLGSVLVADLINYFLMTNHLWAITVNTQSDNLASLALYKKMGFRLSGDSYPVYTRSF